MQNRIDAFTIASANSPITEPIATGLTSNVMPAVAKDSPIAQNAACPSTRKAPHEKPAPMPIAALESMLNGEPIGYNIANNEGIGKAPADSTGQKEPGDTVGNHGQTPHRQSATLPTEAEVLRWHLAINAGDTPHTTAELDHIRRLLPTAKDSPTTTT